MRILVVEDDPVSAEIIRTFLLSEGYEVTCSATGDDAWRLFEANPFRMVITDWKMPGLSGLELCRRIRESAGEQYSYIIMLTASTHNISGLAAGADDFVTKPFDPDELRFRIRSGTRVLELEDRLGEQIHLAQQAHRDAEKVRSRLQEELDAAASTQRSLLPVATNSESCVRFDWSFRPSADLGGDLFNVWKLSDNRCAFVIGDVCGHGVRPALLAVTLQYLMDPRYDHTPLLWTGFATDDSCRVVPPVEVLSRLNRQFPMDMSTHRYFTMLYGIIEAETGVVRYSTAGHPPPLVIPRCGDISQLSGSGVPIGLHDKPDFDEQTIVLSPGDRLLLFSDGLIESKCEEGYRSTTTKLLQCVEDARQLPTGELTRFLEGFAATANGCCHPEDDVSILLLEYFGAGTVNIATCDQTIPQTNNSRV